jgi:hypothetical protein
MSASRGYLFRSLFEKVLDAEALKALISSAIGSLHCISNPASAPLSNKPMRNEKGQIACERLFVLEN